MTFMEKTYTLAKSEFLLFVYFLYISFCNFLNYFIFFIYEKFKFQKRKSSAK